MKRACIILAVLFALSALVNVALGVWLFIEKKRHKDTQGRGRWGKQPTENTPALHTINGNGAATSSPLLESTVQNPNDNDVTRPITDNRVGRDDEELSHHRDMNVLADNNSVMTSPGAENDHHQASFTQTNGHATNSSTSGVRTANQRQDPHGAAKRRVRSSDSETEVMQRLPVDAGLEQHARRQARTSSKWAVYECVA